MVNLNVRLDESEHQRLVRACEGRNCGKSEIVRAALKSYLGSAQPVRGEITTQPQSVKLAYVAPPQVPMGQGQRLGNYAPPVDAATGKPFVVARLLSDAEVKRRLASI